VWYKTNDGRKLINLNDIKVILKIGSDSLDFNFINGASILEVYESETLRDQVFSGIWAG
jgi:hypothetical protein